jgi:Fur family transcriptional regulator, peroxide stress response regulator
MGSVNKYKPNSQFNERLTTNGFRFTPQRQHVYDVLLQKRDHPTAEEVFFRAKRALPEISMATVYNCLDALVRSELVRQVTVDRGAARFCPNMQEHGHFYCDSCQNVFDIEMAGDGRKEIPLPKGFKAHRVEIAIHGACPDCASGSVQ